MNSLSALWLLPKSPSSRPSLGLGRLVRNFGLRALQLRVLFVLLFLEFAPLPVHAQSPAQSGMETGVLTGQLLADHWPASEGVTLSQESSFDLGHSLGRMVFALVVVIGLMLFILKYILPRLHRRRFGSSQRIRILERSPLDLKKSLCLVEVEQRRFLLGLSEQSVSLIAELREPPAS